MSISYSGMNSKLESSRVQIFITADHPLIKLGNILPWQKMSDIVLADLQKTTKGRWWMGRPLQLRAHLSAHILQKFFDLTDRQTEYGLKDNAAYQIFCGLDVVKNWHAPDHTKIAEFRLRLSGETQRALANLMAKHAHDLGFANAKDVDLDSTVQEANISYPSDATLMSKLCGMGKKVTSYLKKKFTAFTHTAEVDMKRISTKARSYFFAAKNMATEKRRKIFRNYYDVVLEEMTPVIATINSLTDKHLKKLPWNIRRSVDQIQAHASKYLNDVSYFIKNHTIKAGKILSWHCHDVACIAKGKVGKAYEFGRVFQLARIKGNFIFVLAAKDLRMEDKHSVEDLLSEHSKLFDTRLKSLATDKGYFSQKNYDLAKSHRVKKIGIQPYATTKSKCIKKLYDPTLKDRRAGIEPLIGHIKKGGQLGKSRMKSDATTLAAGYSSVFSFNLRQFSRILKQNNHKKAA